MENELLFEHLIDDKVSIISNWADLYRAASVVRNGKHDAIKESRTELLLSIALDKLRNELKGEQQKIAEDSYNKLSDSPNFDTIEEIIVTLYERKIIN